MTEQVSQLQAKIEEAKMQVAECTKQIDQEEKLILKREELLSELTEATKGDLLGKRKAHADTPVDESISNASTSQANADQSAKKSRQPPPAYSDNPFQFFVSSAAAAASPGASSIATIAPATPLSPLTSAIPASAPASVAQQSNNHFSAEQVLAEVYVSGTVVLYHGEKASIQSYSKETKKFLVKQGEKEYWTSKNSLVYLPKVGDKILMRERKGNDTCKRFYEAEVVSAEKAPAGVGIRKNSLNIQVKWLDFNSTKSEVITYQILDKLLPIDAENPITKKLICTSVSWNEGEKGESEGGERKIGKGYFLAYRQPEQPAL